MSDDVQTWHYGLVARAGLDVDGCDVSGDMLPCCKQAGFRIEVEKGDWTEADATPDHEVIVYVARK